MKWIQPWTQAVRPLAQINIFPFLLLGETLAYRRTGDWNWVSFLAIHVWGLWLHLWIVFLNDLCDEHADSLHKNPTFFSGGSRVLVQEKLSRKSLKLALSLSGILLVSWSAVQYFVWSQSWIWVMTFAGVLLTVAYELPPLRASYRGGGSWVQSLGVGVVLPITGYLSQHSSLDSFPWEMLLCTGLLAHASYILTALPDEEADRTAKKKTFVVRLGHKKAKAILEIETLALIGLWALMVEWPTASSRVFFIVAAVMFWILLIRKPVTRIQRTLLSWMKVAATLLYGPLLFVCVVCVLF